jgi:transposase
MIDKAMSHRRLVSPQFYEEDFLKAAKEETDVRVYKRLLGLHHFQQGKSYEEISQMLCVHWRSVNEWIKRYRDGGLKGLKNQKGQGRNFILSESDEAFFKQLFIEAQTLKEGGRLTGEDAQKMLEERLGCSYSLRSTYRLLHRVGLSWITGRDIHPHANHLEQEAFKKTLRKKSSKFSLLIST